MVFLDFWIYLYRIFAKVWEECANIFVMKLIKQKLFILFISSLIFSCSEDKLCYEERELEIIPQQGVGPYYIGMTENKLKEILCKNHKYKESKAWFSDKTKKYYFIENMSFILKNNKVFEINVWGKFYGSYKDIDTNYDRELLEYYGEVIKHKGEYRILEIPGIAFGFENSDEGKYIRIFR